MTRKELVVAEFTERIVGVEGVLGAQAVVPDSTADQFEHSGDAPLRQARSLKSYGVFENNSDTVCDTDPALMLEDTVIHVGNPLNLRCNS